VRPLTIRRDRKLRLRATEVSSAQAAAFDAGLRTLELMDGADRYNRWIYDRIRPAVGRRVLEIGCGTGTMTGFFADRELVVGLEVVPEYVEAAQARYRDRPNVVILHHDLTHSVGELHSYRFDSVVSVNVFEHIPDDVRAMRAVRDILEPGGTLNLFVPSHPILHGPFDRAIGHYRRYRKRELSSKLADAGFVVEKVRRTNLLGAFGWFVNVRLLRQRKLRGVRTYDRLVPVLSRIDRLIEPPVGLSLIAVARKP
jgi:SAM-dependent methyltransferase